MSEPKSFMALAKLVEGHAAVGQIQESLIKQALADLEKARELLAAAQRLMISRIWDMEGIDDVQWLRKAIAACTPGTGGKERT